MDEITHKEVLSHPAFRVSCKGKGAVRETAYLVTMGNAYHHRFTILNTL